MVIHARLLPCLLNFLHSSKDSYCALRRLFLQIRRLFGAPLLFMVVSYMILPSRYTSNLFLIYFSILKSTVSWSLQVRLLIFPFPTISSLSVSKRTSRSSSLAELLITCQHTPEVTCVACVKTYCSSIRC